MGSPQVCGRLAGGCLWVRQDGICVKSEKEAHVTSVSARYRCRELTLALHAGVHMYEAVDRASAHAAPVVVTELRSQLVFLVAAHHKVREGDVQLVWTKPGGPYSTTPP
jgi:hypothetical protein